jgi:mannose-1-phosphate guanylyltransferase
MKNFPRQAIVLAAGLGTRLRPLTYRVPKPALPVGGLPILFYNLFLLKEAGVRDVIINLHHQPKKIIRLLEPRRNLGMRIRFSMEPRILGTAGGIAEALRRMKKTPTFVINGDILCDANLRRLYGVHRRTGARATLMCVSKDRAEVDSFVEADGRGRIRRIAGAPRASDRLPSLKKMIFSGIHLIEPSLFAGYPKHTFGCVIRQVYQPALARGERLQAFFHEKEWWDLGSLSQIKRIDRRLWRGETSAGIRNLRREASFWARPLFHHA